MVVNRLSAAEARVTVPVGELGLVPVLGRLGAERAGHERVHPDLGAERERKSLSQAENNILKLGEWIAESAWRLARDANDTEGASMLSWRHRSHIDVVANQPPEPTFRT